MGCRLLSNYYWYDNAIQIVCTSLTSKPDILGPYTAPYAFAQVGYGPGVACFVAFGVMAAYSGLILWHLFLKLDSEKFPLRSFGDLGYRIYGRWFRICTSLISF